jgi:uncharacterized protein RhaS with RHS repeats
VINYASGTATQTYTYDADGNRASYAANGTSPVSLTYTYDTASNRPLGIGGSWTESFTYDANGNMLSHSSPSADYSYEYDARNRLVLSSSGAVGTTEIINGLGQRVGKMGENQPTLFAYDEAGHLTGQYNSTGGLVEETVWLGDLPVAMPFLMACNFAKRLKTLKGLTPYEYICKIWTKESDRFNLNPFQHTVGLDT